MILAYLKYLARHKWFVFVECCKAGIPLAGITHDVSKFRRDEFMPYARSFYGPQYPKLHDISGDARNRALDSGHYKEKVREDFDVAWLLHQHRGPHHWQHWVLREDSGKVKFLEMPERYRIEMICDWKGAGRAMGKGNDVRDWYLKNAANIQLHPVTQMWVEQQLDVTAKVLA